MLTRRWDVGVDSTVVSQLSLGVDTIIVSIGVDRITQLSFGVDTIIVSTGVDRIIVLTGADTILVLTGVDTIIVSTGVDTIIVLTGVDTILVLTGVTTSNWPTVTVGVDCSTGSSWLQGPVSDDSDSVSLGALCSSVALARPGYKGLSVTTATVCHVVLSAPL